MNAVEEGFTYLFYGATILALAFFIHKVLWLVHYKRIQGALVREAVELVQAVGDSVPDHMAVLDPDGEIVNVNAAWQRFAEDNSNCVGLAPARTSIGSNYLDVCRESTGVGSETARQAADGIAAVLSGRSELYTLEYDCDSAHDRRWFHMSVLPLRTQSGGAVVVHADVTQRRRAEDAVRESEAQYRSVVAALDEGILVFGTQGELKACNPRAEQFFGLDFAVLRDPQVLRAWRPLKADGSMLRYADLPASRTLRTGEPCRDELVGLVPLDRGTRLPVGAHITPRPPPAEIDGYVTSSAFSPVLGHTVALAMLRRGRQRLGERLTAYHLGRPIGVEVVRTPFFDPAGERLHA